MTRFALYIHNHQPAGNFEDVFEHSYQHSYKPLLDILLKHPQIKCGIHNSGTLLEWITKRHPEYIEVLKQAVLNQQIELLCSAYGEPILSLIPHKDIVEQIQYYNDSIYKLFAFKPRGLWLTERVWEPQLIHPLLDAGIEYILLDDTHFLYAGLQDDDLFSYLTTEDDGRVLKVFPISMKLRYLIPFHQIDETIDYLKTESEKHDRGLKTLGDDGEKFGAWPGTYDWVYKEGWLNTFLERLEKESWIETVHLKDVAMEQSAGRAYFPTSSYEEMGEWALPPLRGKEYEELKNLIDRKYYYLLHGGYFKNFLQRYPEANQMHKRMLYVSHRSPTRQKAKRALWRGQCSCAYWHGIFGGLYLPHLREAIYRNLIQADNAQPEHIMHAQDFNADGENEIVFSNDDLFAVLDPETGSFIELDDRTRRINICNYLNRREEKYHWKMPRKTAKNGVRSIHEASSSKEDNLNEYLIYDRYIRRFGIDHQLTEIPSVDDFYRGTFESRIVHYPEYTITDPDQCGVTFKGVVEKHLTISNGKTCHLSYPSNDGLFGIEFSVGVFCANLKIDTGQRLSELISLKNITAITLSGDGLEPITFSTNKPCTLLCYPIQTVSSSESGFEKIFQGCCMMFVFAGGSETTISVQL